MEKAFSKDVSLKNERDFNFLKKKNFVILYMSIFSLFIGRVKFLDILNPVVIGYLSLFLFDGFAFYLLALFSLVGIFISFSSIGLIKYIIAIFVLSVANLFLGKILKENKIFIKAVIGSISVLVSGVLISLANDVSIYYMLMAVSEAIFTFCIVFVLRKGTDVLKGKANTARLENEEILSLSIIMAAIIAGASDVYVGSISLRDLFSTYILLVISYKSTASQSAATGLLIGVILNITKNAEISMIVVLAISSLVSGFFNNKNKFYTMISFVLARAFATLYFNSKNFSIDLLVSMLTACVAFYFTKEKFYFNIYKEAEKNSDYIERIKNITKSKLKGFSKAFLKLSVTFNGLSEKKTNLDQKDLSRLVDDIAAKVCVKCKLNKFCWEKNFYNTYQSVFSMLQACEAKGYIDVNDIEINFLNTCINIALFTETSNKYFELYKNDLVWHNKIIESRELVSQQLEGVAEVIDDLSEELEFEMTFRENIERKILNKFEAISVPVDSILVMENKYNKYEILITLDNCIGINTYIKELIPITNKETNRRMKIEELDYTSCTIKLVEEQKFKILTSIASEPKGNNLDSGDSYSYMELRNGQYLMALSDGMGSGRKARDESRASIELLEEFIESGFQKDLAIKIINSVLVLKSSEDSFSTLDLCVVNMYSGEAEFLKIGASSTFLLRNGEVQVIRSSSLPMGILSEVDIEVSLRKLKDEDIIVMVTDGVLEIDSVSSEKEKWIIEKLGKIDSYNPEEISKRLLEDAIDLSKNKVNDDMTILVSRIWKKFS